jgi:LDH2 family malate/lactate/ureidoglycolate dehydrogenase
VHVAAQELRSLLSAAFGRIQAADEASMVADAVVEAALRKDNRVSPVGEAVGDLEKFYERGCPQLSIVAEFAAVRVLDLAGAPGLCYFGAILDDLMSRASIAGLAACGIRNTGGVHGLSAWVTPLARAGYLGVFAWNGGSYTTVPFGSSEPFFGTNPVSYAIPTRDGEPIVADFATSEIPFMNLRAAVEAGTSLPPLAGLDPQGLPSSDPDVVNGVPGDGLARLRPMGGGPKGSALMLLIEILTGALVGSKMGRAASDDPWIPEEFGGLLLAVDPKLFRVEGTFLDDVQQLADDVRRSRPADGFDEVRLPGDGERARLAIRATTGIDIPEDLLARLRVVAGAE